VLVRKLYRKESYLRFFINSKRITSCWLQDCGGLWHNVVTQSIPIYIQSVPNFVSVLCLSGSSYLTTGPVLQSTVMRTKISLQTPERLHTLGYWSFNTCLNASNDLTDWLKSRRHKAQQLPSPLHHGDRWFTSQPTANVQESRLSASVIHYIRSISNW
jgi:hypothetical protein